ncbi:MAG TPA: valine--tRNA ligase [Vicinamibacterales bacterium]|nr:valine--tRNA ligase [Vicinamibacterales bacterium]HPW21942.1 valine--tRNA ligase [Vicinamibacterales bacterium]
MPDLPKVFDHKDVDARWDAFWESIGAFTARPDPAKPVFSMVLPPPNVTGSLHMGHALNHTLPDILARWKRMLGHDVLWLPGTDHAGIATQNVVEKQLALEGKTRHDLGREAFEARVWEWVKRSHATITGQMRKLGESVDWSRERFTLDPGLSRAVRREFVSLYREGLIYRDAYIVNWCPRCRTALSDLEVQHKEADGKLYYVRYPGTAGGPGVTVATTRPETMLGDTAVAVNPGDDRYRGIVGTHVTLPIIGRDLPIIADEFVDPAFGTGAVKVTPGHDPNDFAMGKRHALPTVAVIDEDGRMTQEAGPYAGEDRFTARRAVVEQLEREGRLERVTAHRHAVGHCDRCGTVVEPLVSTQWFVKIAPLAAEAIRAVEDGRVVFLPENWARTYFEWMRNIHDWCISRQLWWGHRIPAWYCRACGRTVVSEEDPAACECGGALVQDTDVLDTWFSSGLWPFSTMGWPDRTPDLARYYPTTLLLTAFDIIFFWVARMIMLGLKFAGDVPFHTVYITGLVRDERGQKMSKSKGNVVDPLAVMDDIGADALRFTLASMASPGMDIPLSEGRMAGYRQFINKIWNASRFLLMNLGDLPERPELPPAAARHVIHRWVLSGLSRLAADVNASLAAYRFDHAADRLYHFFWHEFADWYIEFMKVDLQQAGPGRDAAVAVLVEVHDQLMRLLHPFVPFVTEEIWQKLPKRQGEAAAVALAAFPPGVPGWVDEAAERDVQYVQQIVSAIRTVRSERAVPPSRKIRAVVDEADPASAAVLRDCAAYIRQLAGLEALEFRAEEAAGPDTVKRVLEHAHVYVLLAGVVDRAGEIEKVRKELAGVDREAASLVQKLANEKFVAHAPAAVVAEARARAAQLAERRQKLQAALGEMAS